MMCGRWNTKIITMADGKPLFTVLRCYTELIKECDRYFATLTF